MQGTTATLADLAVSRPAAARVFWSRGLDFCCRGKRPLAEACSEKGLDPEAILAEIEAAETPADLAGWSDRPVEELVDHILQRYHAGLRRDFPVLIAMAERVEDRHAGKPATPKGLATHLRAMQASALQHLEKEERILFPAILDGAGPALAGPVHCMEAEHTDHGENLAATRALTNDLRAPAEACTTWRALYEGLASLERDLMEHIHLENNVLFPRVLMA